MAIDVKQRADVNTLEDFASLQLFSACPTTNKEGKPRVYFNLVPHAFVAIYAIYVLTASGTTIHLNPTLYYHTDRPPDISKNSFGWPRTSRLFTE